MDFFERVGNLFTGGGWSSNKDRSNSDAARKKKEEEERRRREAEAQKAQAQASKKPKTVAEPKSFATPPAFASLEGPKAKAAPAKQKSELDRLYEEQLASTKSEMEKREDASHNKQDYGGGPVGLIQSLAGDAQYHMSGKQGLDERAKAAARDKAASIYAERNKYSDKAVTEVNAYGQETKRGLDELRKSNEDAIKNTKTAVDVMRYVPGAGLGELGANVVRGNFSGSRQADDTLLMEQMDLKPGDIAKLSQSDRDKYLLIAKAGLGSGVLDLAGLGVGGLVKKGVTGGFRTIGRELVEGEAKQLAKTTLKQTLKDMLTKEGAKALAKRTLISGAAGAGLGYGGSKLMGASDADAAENALSGFISAGLGSTLSSPFDAASDTLVKGSKANLRNIDLETENLDSTIKNTMPEVANESQVVRDADNAVAEAEAEVARVETEIPESMDIEPGSGVKSVNLAEDAKAVARQQAQAALDAARAQQVAAYQAEIAVRQDAINNQALKNAPAPEVAQPVGRNVDAEAVAAREAADAQVNEAAMAPLAQAEAPSSQVIDTPIEAASKEAPAPVTLPKRLPAEDALSLPEGTNVDDAFARLEDAYDKGEISEAEYQAYDKQLFDKYEKTGDVIAAKGDANSPVKLKPGEQVIEEVQANGKIKHIVVDKDFEMVRALSKAEEKAYADIGTEVQFSKSTRPEDTQGARIAKANNEAPVKIVKPATRTVEEGYAAMGLPYKPKGAKAKTEPKVEAPVEKVKPAKKVVKAAKTVVAEAPVAPVKVKAPKKEKTVVEPTPVVTAAKDNLTKSGTVNQKWFNGRMKEIQDGTLSKGEKIKAITALGEEVKTAEGEAAALKAKTAAPETTRRANAKPGEAAKEQRAENAKQAPVRTPSEEYVKTSKAGGHFPEYLAEIDKTISGGAMHLDDYKRSLPKKEQMNFDAEMKKSDAEVTAMSDESALVAVNSLHESAKGETKLGDTVPLNTKQTMQLVSLKKRLAYMVDTLVSKKTLTAAEETKLADIKRAQVKLYESGSASLSETGRTLGLSGWLYKNLDPFYVSERAIKHMEDAGHPYTPEQDVIVRKNTKTLQDAHNTVTDTETQITDLRSKLGKGTKAEQKATREALDKAIADYPEQFKALGAAYETANTFALDHWDEGVKAGKIIQPQTFGMATNRFQKLNMLSGIFGRVRDLATTGTVGIDMMLDDSLGILLGKAANTVGRTNKFDGSFRGAKGNVKRGWAEGLRKTTGTYAGTEDPHMGLLPEAGGQRNGQTPTNMTDRALDGTAMNVKRRKPTNNLLVKGVRKVGDIIRGNTAIPTHIYGEPYKAHRLSVAGMDEAKRLGLKGDDAQAFARSYEILPPKDVNKTADFDAREMSGLQSKVSKGIDKLHRAALKKFATWDGVKEGNWRIKKGAKMVAGGTITVIKNTAIPFTSWPLGAAQSMVTRQNPLFHAWNATVDTVSAIRSGDEAAARSALKNWSKVGYSSAKVAATAVILAPLLSDTDADGEGYNPPYIKIPTSDGKYWSSDLSMLGPLAMPLVNAWAAKRAMESDKSPKDKLLMYSALMAKGTLGKVGLTTALNGQGIPVLKMITDVVSSPYRDTESVSKGASDEGDKFVTDVASQSIPLGSFMRDINATVNTYGGGNLRLTPQTKVYKEDGKTVDWQKTGWNQLMSSIPGVNQSMERNTEGKQSQSVDERITGSKQSSPGAVEKNQTEAKKVKGLNDSIAPILGDKKYRDLLSTDDLKKLYDKAGKKELTSSELAEIRNDIVGAADQYMEKGEYEDYAKIKKIQLDKLKANPKSKPSEIAAAEHSIKIGGALKKYNVKYELYKLYAKSDKAQGGGEDGLIGGISQDELKKMYDKDSEYYNPQMADALVQLDKQLAAEGASDNSMDAKKTKYDLDKIRKALSGGGGGSDSIVSGAGTVNYGKTVSGDGFKGRALKMYNSPIPNLSASAARTNLKKTITVQKGVKL